MPLGRRSRVAICWRNLLAPGTCMRKVHTRPALTWTTVSTITEFRSHQQESWRTLYITWSNRFPPDAKERQPPNPTENNLCRSQCCHCLKQNHVKRLYFVVYTLNLCLIIFQTEGRNTNSGQGFKDWYWEPYWVIPKAELLGIVVVPKTWFRRYRIIAIALNKALQLSSYFFLAKIVGVGK